MNLPPESLLRGQQQVLEMVARNAPLADSLAAIARLAEHFLPDMMASILYYDPRVSRLRAGGYARLPRSFAEIVDGLVPGPNMGSCGTCAYTGERIISEDVYRDPLWADFLGVCREYGIHAAWSTPLKHSRDASVLGVFGMYYPTPRTPSAADLEFVDHFTNLASIAAQRHRDDDEQRHRATHDALTGLGNRHLLDLRGPQILADARHSGRPLSVAFIDLDSFKPYNDVFGHVQGDLLLRRVAEQIAAVLAPADLIARFGGDEFIAFLPEPAAAAHERIQSLQRALARELEISGTPVRVTFSCGLFEYERERECTDLDALVFRADEASRRAKQLGGDRCVITDSHQSVRSVRRRELARQLVDALDAGLLVAHLQPILELASGRPVGLELLLRLNDPRYADIDIAECISVAEETGLIHRVGSEVMRTACELLVRHADELGTLVLHVNLSARQLMRGQFVEQVGELLARHALEPRRICFEVAESSWLESDGPARDALLALSRTGFGVALDDFGTGYASLTFLQSLPFAQVKIDRSFIASLDRDDNAPALCAALLSMGRACGMQVVAEGVETPAQARELAQLGVPRAQGYLWSRPLAADQALSWLRATSPGGGSATA